MRIEVIEPKLFSGVIADEFAALMGEAVEERGVCTVALSGGKTPGQVYRALSLPPRVTEISWKQLKLFWGDERWVGADDTRSNFNMVNETLLAHLRSEKPAVFKVNTSAASPEAGASEYHRTIDREVEKENGIPVFDIMILGVGEDGHTASLFPECPVLNDTSAWAFPVVHPVDGTQRVTMSAQVLTAARNIVFIVKGAVKSQIVAQVIQGSAPAERYPARIFTRAEDRVTWFLDSEAASKLSGQH